MRKILLLKAGEAAIDLRLGHGDYDRWFQTALASRVEVEVVAVYKQQPRDPPTGYDGVIMTGSPQSVTEPSNWMRLSADYLLSAARQGVPILGVCFGHQLLGYALGSRVVRNPRGREIGSVSISLTEAGKRDKLFDRVPAEFGVQATHEDIVADIPPGALVLASNENSTIQAMAIGANVRSVQFHPEMDSSIITKLIHSRREKLEIEAAFDERGTRVRTLLAGIRPTPSGPRILQNFIDHFVA